MGLPTSRKGREDRETKPPHHSTHVEGGLVVGGGEDGEDDENEVGKPVESTTHSPCRPAESTLSSKPGARSAAPISPLARTGGEDGDLEEEEDGGRRRHRCRWRRI